MTDGASRWTAFWRVALPLTRPGLVTTWILCLVFAWNDYAFAQTFSGTSGQTLPIAATQLITQTGIDWGQVSAIGAASGAGSSPPPPSALHPARTNTTRYLRMPLHGATRVPRASVTGPMTPRLLAARLGARDPVQSPTVVGQPPPPPPPTSTTVPLSVAPAIAVVQPFATFMFAVSTSANVAFVIFADSVEPAAPTAVRSGRAAPASEVRDDARTGRSHRPGPGAACR